MTQSEVDTVVIGAGFAGLACADRLAARGIDFAVLEARDRVGGRAWTDYATARGSPLELGALMVHGRKVATQSLLRSCGFHTEPLLRVRAIRLVLDRRLTRMPWMALPGYRAVGPRRLYRGLVRLPKALGRYEGEDMTLDAYLRSQRADAATRALVELNHAHIYAMDPSEIGVLGPAEETRAAAEPWDYHNFRIVEGYSALADRLAASCRPRLFLGTEVSRIRWSSAPAGVEIHAKQQGEEFVLAAKRAVVTLPLGVLQAGTVTFDPPLPPEKRQAIAELVMTDAFTVHLRIRGGTLGARLGDTAFVWAMTSSSFFLAPPAQTNGERFVSAFTVGRGARDRLGLSEADLAQVTLEELRTALPADIDVGLADGWAVHRWTRDPWARGAYSCIPLGGHLSARATLAEPVEQTLFFAGEATHCLGSPATVHGAIETGWRAAEEILAVEPE